MDRGADAIGGTVATDLRSTIVVEGQDQFSAMFGKLNAEAKKSGEAIGAAAGRAEALSERAGDAERGFLGLKDIIGGVAQGPLSEIADRMGGIEAVIKGFGPAMGAVGIAIAAAGMAASYMYERAEKARKAALDVEIQRLSYLESDNAALAQHLKVSGDLLGVKTSVATVEETIGAAQGHARDILKNQQAILEAQKEKEEEKIGLLERQQATLRGLLAVDELRLQKAREAADALRMAAGESSARTREREEQETRLAGIMDVQERLRQKDWYRQQERVQLEAEANRLAKSGFDTGAQHAEIEARRLEVARRLRTLAGEELSDAREGEAVAAARAARAKAGAASAEAAARAARDAQAKFAAELDKGFAAEREHREFMEQSRAKELADIQAVGDRVAAQQVAAAQSPAARARLALADAERRAARERAEIESAFGRNYELQQLQLLEVDQRVAAERLAIHATLDQAQQESAAKAAAESQQKQDQAFAVAGAVVAGLEQVGIAEQAAAGLKAALAAAEAGLAAARGNWGGAVAGAFSAIQFGRIALGGGTPQTPPGLGGNSGMGTGGQRQQGQSSGGSGGAVVINFNKGFFGDAASTAKGISGAMKTIGNSGIPAFRGA